MSSIFDSERRSVNYLSWTYSPLRSAIGHSVQVSQSHLTHPHPCLICCQNSERPQGGLRHGRTSGFLCGASTTSQLAFVLSSHKREKSSDGDCTRCNANEQTTISIGVSASISAAEFETLPNEVKWEMVEGKAPPAISVNERDAQDNVVRSRYASAVYCAV